jgi:hypothetical protein
MPLAAGPAARTALARITGICMHAGHHAPLRHLMIAETFFLAERKSPYRGLNLP